MQHQDVQKAPNKRSVPGDEDGDATSVSVRVRAPFHHPLQLPCTPRPWAVSEAAAVVGVHTHTHTQLICLSAVLSISCAWTANLRIILNCLISFEQLEAETRTETSSLHPWIELNVSLLPSPLPLFSSTRLSIP